MKEELKISLLGANGTGKTAQLGRLIRACPEFAPMVLIAAERGSEVLQDLVDEGLVHVVPAKSPEDVKRILELLRKPVTIVDGVVKRGGEGAFRAKMVTIDSYSAVAKRAIDQEMELGEGDVGPEGRTRRKNYGANQYRDWNGEARKRLESMLARAEDLVDDGVIVALTCAWKQIFDRSKDDYSSKVMPALPGGPHFGGMAQALRGWARYQWALYNDGNTYFALTQQLSAQQHADPRMAWAKPFGRWPKSSVPDVLRPVRNALLPSVLPDPDLGKFWLMRRRALELVANGDDPGTLGFLQKLADEGHPVRLPKQKQKKQEK